MDFWNWTAEQCREFWINLYANGLSDLLVGIVVGLIIYNKANELLRKRQEPAGRILGQMTGSSDEGRFVTLSLVNTGNTAFAANEVSWQIYIRVQDVNHFNPSSTERVMLGDEQYARYKDVLVEPVFHSFPVKVKDIDVLRLPKSQIYYALSTTYGLFPKGVKFDLNGVPQLSTLGKVEIRAAD